MQMYCEVEWRVRATHQAPAAATAACHCQEYLGKLMLLAGVKCRSECKSSRWWFKSAGRNREGGRRIEPLAAAGLTRNAQISSWQLLLPHACVFLLLLVPNTTASRGVNSSHNFCGCSQPP